MAYRFDRVWTRAQRSLLALFATSAFGLSTGCNSEATEQRDVELRFDVKVGSQRVACGKELPSVGTNGRKVTLGDLRFFVHDVQLIDAKGKKVALEIPDDGLWQYKNLALLDFEDRSGDCRNGTAATNAIIRGKAAAGDYTGLSFRIGVPEAINHGDTKTFRDPLAATTLHWDWLQGFIFFRLDLAMAQTGDDGPGKFEVHLGSDRCSKTSKGFECARINVADVALSKFDDKRDKVVLDLGALLQKLTVAHRKDAMGEDLPEVPGCTSSADDPDCAPMFDAFGLDLQSGSAASAPQSIFSVQPRDSDDPGRSVEGDAGVVNEDDAQIDAGAASYELKLPTGFAPPTMPADNPLSASKIELGRHLFYDTRLSGNQTQACASCHKQELAFTDGRAVGLGSTGEMHIRGAMSLANIAYSSTLTWANATLTALEEQARTPLFGEKPVELGLRGREDEMIARLRDVPEYKDLFPKAFAGEADPFTLVNVLRAIASFERTLISGNSPFDRFKYGGEENAISESAKRGAEKFFDPNPNGSAFECFHCHGGPTFSDQLTHANQLSGEEPFHNTGLYNLDIYGAYPSGNEGIFEFTGDNHDRGRFKAPTLRNIAVTAPYMHDGSIATLEDVVAHYARGGRNIESGPNFGDGKRNPNKSEFIHGFPGASEQDRADLIEFLKSLTDEEFLTNPAYSDPWKK